MCCSFKGVVRKFSLMLDKDIKEVRKADVHMKGNRVPDRESGRCKAWSWDCAWLPQKTA